MLVLSHEDLLKAGCFDISMSIAVAENTILQYHNGNILYPDKVSQIFDIQTQERINCLPATLFQQKICGMKWVAVFPPNPTVRNLPNLNATILLSEIESGYPIAIMDGTLCSDLRTAAISAVAAKYLARKNVQTIGFIGSGEQAKMHLLTLTHLFPTLKHCKVASRNQSSEIAFKEQMTKLIPDIEITVCKSNYELSARNSDIVVSAISAQLPILQSDWLDEGVLYCHVGGWEDDYSVPLSMDKIICDDWNSVKHRTQTISRLYQKGDLNDNDIYADLHEIVSSEKRGRVSEKEKIYFNAVGLSYVDIALAFEFYNKAKKYASYDLNILKHSVFYNAEKYLIK